MQHPSDEEPTKHEKDVDPEKAVGEPADGVAVEHSRYVEEKHQENRDAPDTVQAGDVTSGLKSGWLFRLVKLDRFDTVTVSEGIEHHKDVATESHAHERWAAVTFGVLLAAAFPVILFWLGSRRWFSQDEWYFLQYRTLSFEGIFSPYFGHLMALPIITWQLMFRIFGLHSYRPYQALTVILHIAICVMIRTVMRRSGVSPWVATVTAGAFILYGSGYQNIDMAMEINYLGSIFLGLIFLLLSDHTGERLTKGDVLGILCGFAALMCSNIGISMVVGVVGAALLRRRWKPAAIMCAPLAAFGAWYVTMGRSDASVGISGKGAELSGSAWHWIHEIVAWNAVSLRSVPEGLVRNGVGLTVPLALVVGALVLVGITRSVQRRMVLPIALAGAAIVFVTSSAIGRGEFPASTAATPRYVYVVTLLLLPLLAVGIQLVVNYRRVLLAPAAVILLIGVPGNISAFTPKPPEANFTLVRQQALAIANSPYASNADPDLSPMPSPFLPGPSVGWLVEAQRQGKVPTAEGTPPEVQNWVNVLLQIRQLSGSSGTLKNCVTGTRFYVGVILAPRNGEVIDVSVLGASKSPSVTASLLGRKTNFPLPGGARSFALVQGDRFRFAGDGLHVGFTSPNGMVRICR